MPLELKDGIPSGTQGAHPSGPRSLWRVRLGRAGWRPWTILVEAGGGPRASGRWQRGGSLPPCSPNAPLQPTPGSGSRGSRANVHTLGGFSPQTRTHSWLRGRFLRRLCSRPPPLSSFWQRRPPRALLGLQTHLCPSARGLVPLCVSACHLVSRGHQSSRRTGPLASSTASPLLTTPAEIPPPHQATSTGAGGRG